MRVDTQRGALSTGEQKASLVRAAPCGVCERCCPGTRVHVHITWAKQEAVTKIGSIDLQVLNLISAGVGLGASARRNRVIEY